MLALVSLPFISHAQEASGATSANWITSGVLAALGTGLAFILNGLAYIAGYIAGAVFTFAGLFLSFGLRLNGTLLQSPTVNVGWTITRDLANLGFVLAIIFIAVATILRVEKYGMTKILRRLIVVALLINFSLTFAGILIDASGLITNFFMAKVVPPQSGANLGNMHSTSLAFSETLANAFGVQKALNPKNMMIEGASDFGPKTVTLLANVFFVVIFTIMGSMLMLAIAALVFVRYVALMILLILMPLAWLGWIFEGSEFYNAFKMWWSEFFKWLFWLPVAIFFMYLSVLIVVNQSQDANSVTQIAKSVQSAPAGNVLDKFLGYTGPPSTSPVPIPGVTGALGVSTGTQGSGGIFETFGQMAAVLIILGGGLLTAQRLSGLGSNIVLGFAGTARNYMMGKVQGTAQKTLGYGSGYYAGKYAGYAGGKALSNYLRKEDEKGQSRGQRWSARLAKIGLAGSASALSNYVAKSKDDLKKEATDFQKQNLANLSNDALKTYPTTFKEPQVLAAVGAEMAKRNILPESKEDLAPYVKAMKESGFKKDILANRPDLAEEFGDKIKDAVRKISDVAAISKKSFENSEVLLSLNNNQLNQLRRNEKITEDTIDTIKSELKKAYSEIKKEIKDKAGTASPEEINELQKKQENIFSKIKVAYLTPSWSVKELSKEQKAQRPPKIT